jgi:hypothetical protein
MGLVNLELLLVSLEMGDDFIIDPGDHQADQKTVHETPQ